MIKLKRFLKKSALSQISDNKHLHHDEDDDDNQNADGDHHDDPNNDLLFMEDDDVMVITIMNMTMIIIIIMMNDLNDHDNDDDDNCQNPTHFFTLTIQPNSTPPVLYLSVLYLWNPTMEIHSFIQSSNPPTYQTYLPLKDIFYNSGIK